MKKGNHLLVRYDGPTLEALVLEAPKRGCRIDVHKRRTYIFYGADCPLGVECGSPMDLNDELENYRL